MTTTAMYRTILSFFIVASIIGIVSLALASVALAQDAAADEEILPAGITPQSPFYAIDRFFERAGLFFVFNRSARAARLLAIAEERLSEAEALADQGDARSEELALEYDSTLATASIEAELSGNEETETAFAERAVRHAAVLDRVIEKVPDQAKESVRAARDHYVDNHVAVMRKLAEKNPERAAKAFAAAAERRANAIARAAEDRGKSAAERAREARERAEEFGKYAEFGEEVSLIARKLRTGEATVYDLVKRATAQHIQALEDVRARVPKEALQGVDTALQNARRVRALNVRTLSDSQVDAGIDIRKRQAEARREKALRQAESFAPEEIRERVQRARQEREERERSLPTSSGIRSKQDAFREATRQVKQEQGESDAFRRLRSLPR